jgi:hypothetical protein
VRLEGLDQSKNPGISPITLTESIINKEFEVLTAVVMKNSVFWEIAPCSPLKVNRRFGRCQGRRVSQARINLNQVARKANFHFERMTLRCIPEDILLSVNANHFRHNLSEMYFL